MKPLLLSMLFLPALFAQQPKQPDPWMPKPVADLEAKKGEIMALIIQGMADYNEYKDAKADENAKRGPALDRDAPLEVLREWHEAQERLYKAAKAMGEPGKPGKLDQALTLTVHAFGIRPNRPGTIQGGLLMGRERAWQAGFYDQEKTVRPVEVMVGGIKRLYYIDVPAAGEEDRAKTKDDGFTAVRIKAFLVAIEENDPSSLAGTLYHEAVHYARLVTKDREGGRERVGWRSQEEEELFAYTKKLEAKDILGLSPDQIAASERERKDYDQQVSEIRAGRASGESPYLASLHETDNREFFRDLQRGKAKIEGETKKLEARMNARQSIRNLQAMADRACLRPQTMYDGEADSFERSYSGSWSEDIGINPNSAIDSTIMGCPARMLEKLLSERSSAGRAFSGKSIKALAQSVVQEERRQVQEAAAKLHGLARKSCERPGSLDEEDAWRLHAAYNAIDVRCSYFGLCLPWAALVGLERGCAFDTLDVFLAAKAKAKEESSGGRFEHVGADDLNAIGRQMVRAVPSDVVWRLVLSQHEDEGRRTLGGYAAKACLKPGSLTREDAGEIRKAYVLLDEYRLATPGYSLPDSALRDLSGCVREMMEFMLRSQQEYGTAPLGPWEEFYNSYSGEIARKHPSGQEGQGGQTQPGQEPGRVKLPSEDEIRRRMDDIRRRLRN